MAINKVEFGNTTIIDLTDTTAEASDVASGKYFYTKAGVRTLGTNSGGGASQSVYVGESSPSSSLGDNGDIFLLADSGGTAEATPADFTSTDMSSTSNLGACIGKTAEEGTATSNSYSSGSSVTGVVDYTFDIPSIPTTATITSVSCLVKAHEENASRSTFTLQLYSGSTKKGSQTTVNGTSNTIYTLTTGTWTRSEIDDLTLHCRFGYYGGGVAGATLTIEYSMPTASANVTLSVSESGWSISGEGIYKKQSGSWSTASSVTLDDIVQRS